MMQHPRRFVLWALIATCLLLVGGGSPARAAPPSGGLELAVHATDAAAPSVTLTNRAAAACRVAATSLGTMIFTRVEQGGSVIQPISSDVSFDDSVDRLMADRLRTLNPGSSVTVPLRVVPLGPTGHALETVAWSRSEISLGSLYPIRADKPLRLDVVYAVPATVEGSPPLCDPVATPGAAGAKPGRRWLLWAMAGGGLLVLIGAVMLLVVLTRRGKARRAGAVAVLLMVGLLAPELLPAKAAHAEIVVDPSLASAWTTCGATLHGPGGDPAGILATLEAAGIRVELLPANGDQTHEGGLSQTHMFIFWNLDDHHPYAGTGGNADPCTALYHELYHAWEDANGGQDHSPCVTADGPSGLPVNEVNATRAQNRLRQALGMPPRSHYGDTPLPAGDCLPPDRQPHAPQCTGRCADSNGDPHLRTFEGVRYDFQAVGEFVAARDSAGGFQIQVRQQPLTGSRVASLNSAVAMDVAGDRVEIRLVDTGLSLVVGGTERPMAAATLPGGGSIAVSPGTSGPVPTVTWPDGSSAILAQIGAAGIHLTVAPAPARSGRLEGILAKPASTPATFEALYPSYADSWRVDGKSSLFTYQAGTTTATYTDRTFPDRAVNIDQLPNRAAAEALCRRLGVTDPDVLRDCVLDVALTGQPDFAVAALAGQLFVGSGTDGPLVTMTVSEPGAAARHTFTGAAGQRVFVDVVSSTLPDQCGVLLLRKPDGGELASGCILHGTGYVDGTVLPVAGEYTLVLDPADTRTGEARLRVITSIDQQAPITVDGPISTLRLAQPGAVGRFTFDAKAGQKVFVDVPSASLPDQCGVISVRKPDGGELASGCLLHGNGYVDGTVLPVDGQYMIVVDPGDRGTGEARLRLSSATDEQGTITLDGPTVTATVAKPGAAVRLTFTGTAGQRVAVAVPSANLPDQCGVLILRQPDGGEIASGCVLHGTGDLASTVLPVSGEYTIVVDPGARGTGQAQLHLHS